MDLHDNVAQSDRWSFNPALIALATVSTLAVLCQLPGTVSFFLIPIALLGLGIATLVVLAITVFLLVKKRPRKGASIFFVLLIPALLWLPIRWTADMVHLGLTVGFGAGQLGHPSEANHSDFAVYDWSVGFAGGPNTILIHDVTDEIAMPIAQHTHPLSSENGFGEECAGKVYHLSGHYFVCTF